MAYGRSTTDRRRVYVTTTDRGELDVRVVYPASLACLPVPEQLREAEAGLSDALGAIETAVLARLVRRAG